jgi:hypothetical protein
MQVRNFAARRNCTSLRSVSGEMVVSFKTFTHSSFYTACGVTATESKSASSATGRRKSGKPKNSSKPNYEHREAKVVEWKMTVRVGHASIRLNARSV